MCREYSSQLGLSVLQHEDPRQYMLPGEGGEGGRGGLGMPPNLMNLVFNIPKPNKSYSHVYVVHRSSAHMLTSSEIFA